MAESKEVISTLNDLLETSIDGEEGFRKAADAVEDPNLKQYFSDRSKEVSVGVSELQNLVLTYGGEPVRTSSLAGTIHRHWIDLRTAITSNDTVAVLDEAERGEDVALETYRKAAQKDLPENVRSVVERQLEGVLRNHNRVKQLRDVARNSAH